jgi:hypothetical protein
MTKKITRRKVLAATGASITVGSVGQVTASNSQQESAPDHSVPNLTIRNNRRESGVVEVEFTKISDGEERGEVAFSARYQLAGHGNPDSVTRRAVSLSGGTYEVSASVDGGPSESVTISLPPGGFPDWRGVSIRSMPGNRLVVSKLEA